MGKSDQIKKLSAEILAEVPEMETMEIYTLIESDEEGENIAFGELSGLPDNLWPKDCNGDKMDFHFVLKLSDFPALKARFPNSEALLFFSEDEAVWNERLDDDEEFEVQDNKVVFLTKKEYDYCSIDGEYQEPISLTVPTIVFGDPSKDYFDVKRDAPTLSKDLQEKLKKLNDLIFQLPIRICGYPIWLQSNEGITNFMMQFDEVFVDMNMGDSGVMYLYEHSGFWQCY